jgi:hypothetical protein
MIRRSFRLPGLWLGPDDVWLTREAEVPDEPGLERMTRLAAPYLVHAWSSDPELFAAVVRFLGPHGIDAGLTPGTETETIDAIIVLIESERIWVWERPTPPVTLTSRVASFPSSATDYYRYIHISV